MDGDLAMYEAEVQATLVFLHFWGIGPAAGLARGLRSALDAQAAAWSSR